MCQIFCTRVQMGTRDGSSLWEQACMLERGSDELTQSSVRGATCTGKPEEEHLRLPGDRVGRKEKVSLRRWYWSRALKDVGVGRKVFREEQMQAYTYMGIAVCSTGEKETWGMLGCQATNWEESRSRRAQNAKVATDKFESCRKPLIRLRKAINARRILHEAHWANSKEYLFIQIASFTSTWSVESSQTRSLILALISCATLGKSLSHGLSFHISEMKVLD